MREKEAREILKNAEYYEFNSEWFRAKSYLEAIDKAKVLEDALKEMYDDGNCWDTKDEEECGECGWCHSKQAINQWEVEK